LMEFAGSTSARCEQIEQCMESLKHYKKDFDALQGRLAPLEDQERGVESIFNEVDRSGDLLSKKLESLEGNGEASLFKRVQRLTELKKQFEYRVTRVLEQFTELDGIHGEMSTLFSRLNQAQRPARELDANLRIVS
jgi:chromosome segregation ATPase